MGVVNWDLPPPSEWGTQNSPVLLAELPSTRSHLHCLHGGQVGILCCAGEGRQLHREDFSCAWVFERCKASPWVQLLGRAGIGDLAEHLLLTHSSYSFSPKRRICFLYVTSSSVLLPTRTETCWKSVSPNPKHHKHNNKDHLNFYT